MFSRPEKTPRPTAESARRTVAAAQAKAKDGVRAAPSKASREVKAAPKALAGEEEALHLSKVSAVRGEGSGVGGGKPFSLLPTPDKASTPGGVAPSQTEESTVCAAGPAEGSQRENLALPSPSSGGSADMSAKVVTPPSSPSDERGDRGPVQRDDGVWVVSDRTKVVRTEVPFPVHLCHREYPASVDSVSARAMLEAPAGVGVWKCPCVWVVLKEAAFMPSLT